MFINRRPASTAGLEAARDDSLRKLAFADLCTDERKAALKETKILSDLIAKEKREPLSFNVVVPAAATLLSVFIVTDFEKLNVITSKAVQFLPKLLK